MEEEAKPVWEGKASAKLTGLEADQVWPLLEDFFSIHKWLPSIDTCRRVEGVSRKPGCIRYCASTSISSDDTGTKVATWATERLLSIDEIQRCFCYEVVDSNMGFKAYMGTMKVLEEADGGCNIEWSFKADPIQGWELEQLVGYLQVSLQGMAEKIKMALLTTN